MICYLLPEKQCNNGRNTGEKEEQETPFLPTNFLYRVLFSTHFCQILEINIQVWIFPE